jgi:hypothetical protein
VSGWLAGWLGGRPVLWSHTAWLDGWLDSIVARQREAGSSLDGLDYGLADCLTAAG